MITVVTNKRMRESAKQKAILNLLQFFFFWSINVKKKEKNEGSKPKSNNESLKLA